MNRRIWFVAAVLIALGPSVVFAQGAPGGEATPIDHVSDFAMWAIIGGFVTSVVTGVINRSHWASDVKLGVFLALCVVTSGLDAWFKRELDFHNVSRALLVVVASGVTTYLATKPAIQKLETRTS